MSEALNRKAVFISPIGAEKADTRLRADQALRHIVGKALQPLHIEVEWAEEDDDRGLLTRRVINSIMNADLVVADLSLANANVYYEVGIAHAYGKPCVHMITEGESIPFDVKDIRTVEYTLTDPEKMENAVIELRKHAESALDRAQPR